MCLQGVGRDNFVTFLVWRLYNLNTLIGVLYCTQTRSVCFGCNYIRAVLLSPYDLRHCEARSSKNPRLFYLLILDNALCVDTFFLPACLYHTNGLLH